MKRPVAELCSRELPCRMFQPQLCPWSYRVCNDVELTTPSFQWRAHVLKCQEQGWEDDEFIDCVAQPKNTRIEILYLWEPINIFFLVLSLFVHFSCIVIFPVFTSDQFL